jgi:hypothetical protein
LGCVAAAFSQNSNSGSTPLHKEIQNLADQKYATLEQLYKHLHANPELSFHEEKTAAVLDLLVGQ